MKKLQQLEICIKYLCDMESKLSYIQSVLDIGVVECPCCKIKKSKNPVYADMLQKCSSSYEKIKTIKLWMDREIKIYKENEQ